MDPLERIFKYAEAHLNKADRLLAEANRLHLALRENAEEAESLFGNESKRKAKATPWAIQNLAYADSESGVCWWWLRSPGTKSDCAASVCDGTVNTEGLKIDYTSNSVRPAIKFNLNMYAQIIREQEEKAQ